jgi:hypothetical protein
MFASLSSSSSSAPVSDIISQWKNSCIQSCVLGISKIGMTSNLSTKISHAAILLLNKEIDYDEDDDNIILDTNGILIEYGEYDPNKDEEKNKVKKGLVVYHYGEKGGLRYYIKKYGRFIEEFGDIGYIDLNIHSDNQISFDTFLDKIAKLEDNKWTLNNYSAIYNFNCQNFAIEALHELNPHFVIGNIYPKDPNLAAKKSKKKLDFVPSNIKEELLKLYKNGKK